MQPAPAKPSLLPRSILGLTLLLLLALPEAGASAAVPREAPAPACDLEGLRIWLADGDLDVPAAALVQPGMLAHLRLGPEDALLWFGLGAGGQLVTASRVYGPAASSHGDDEARLPAQLKALFERLNSAGALVPCEALRADNVPGKVDGLLQRAERMIGRDVSARATRGWLPLLVHVLGLLTLLAWLALSGIAVWRALRAAPRESLLLFGLAGLALGIRLFSSERLPIGAANGDLTHLDAVATWMTQGLDIHHGAAYPPAYRLLLWLLAQVTGPSLQLAFLLTTVLGALCVIPAYLIARDATGSRAAGVIAALALAAYPPSILFSNGVNLVIPAAFWLASAFAWLCRYLEHRRPWLLGGLGVNLLLFGQARLESLGVGVAVLFGMALLVFEHGRPRELRRVLLAFAVAALFFLPYLGLLFGSRGDLHHNPASQPALLEPLLVFTVVGTVMLILHPRLRRSTGLRLMLLGAASWASISAILQVAREYPGSALWAKASHVPEFPFTTFYSNMSLGRFDSFDTIHPWFEEPALVPLLLLPFLFLAFVTPRDLPSRRSWLMAPVLIGIALVAQKMTSFIATGIVMAEGLRLHVAYVGLVAAAIGIGAARLVEALDLPAVGRGMVVGLVAALVLSPVLTHRAFYSDTRHNPQEEFLFLRDSMAQVPQGATLLFADDRLDLRADGLGHAEISTIFRAEHLIRALAWTQGKQIKIQGLRDYLSQPLRRPGPTYIFLGLDCHRSPNHRTENPSCAHARALAPGERVATRAITNRLYSSQSMLTAGITIPEIELALLALDDTALEALEARVRGRRRDR